MLLIVSLRRAKGEAQGKVLSDQPEATNREGRTLLRKLDVA